MRAQFAKNFRRYRVSRAVGAVHHDFQALERQPEHDRVFAEFDVTAARFGDAVQFAQLRRFDDFHRQFEVALDFLFGGVGQFDAAAREYFDAVVAIDVMRGADDDSRGRMEGAGEVGDAGGRHDAEQMGIHTRGGKSGGNGVFQHVTGDARVFADDDFIAGKAAVAQHFADGPTEMHDEIGRHWRYANFAPHAVRAEIFSPCLAHECSSPLLPARSQA